MPKDFLGYDRNIMPNGSVMSSEYATIALGSSRISLVQSVTAEYAQMTTPKYESGSPTLYWLTGQPSGAITMGRLVGKEGFLKSLASLHNSCGSLIGVTLGLNGTGACIASASAKTPLTFQGAVPNSLSISWSAGTLEVQEGCRIAVASLSAA